MMRRSAFSLVELLVVIAIIGVLVALLLPAIQSARETARRASCQNHLRQLALAVQAYHDVQRSLPAMYTISTDTNPSLAFGLDTHSWRTSVLPFIEENASFESMKLFKSATDLENQVVVGQSITLFNCPSTPRSTTNVRGLWHGRSQFNEALEAATTDYNGSAGYVEAGVASRQSICDPSVTQYLWEENWTPGAFGEVKYAKVVWEPPTIRQVRFKDLTDGLAQTALVLERAGLPDQYFDGGNSVEPHEPPQYRTWGNVGLWAISGVATFNQLYHQTGAPLVNFDNMLGLYSFHPGGVHLAHADGSVHFLVDDTSTELILALISRAGDELVAARKTSP